LCEYPAKRLFAIVLANDDDNDADDGGLGLRCTDVTESPHGFGDDVDDDRQFRDRDGNRPNRVGRHN